jgi:hypothetical protein
VILDYFSFFVIKAKLFNSYFCKRSKTPTIFLYTTSSSILTMTALFLSVIFFSSSSSTSSVTSLPLRASFSFESSMVICSFSTSSVWACESGRLRSRVDRILFEQSPKRTLQQRALATCCSLS